MGVVRIVACSMLALHAGCWSSSPQPQPIAKPAPTPRAERPPDHERTVNVDVVAENTAMGTVITMTHHHGATWACRVTNIGMHPITLDLARSAFRTARGTRLGPLRSADSDFLVLPDGAARTFLVTPRPLRRLRNDARMWPVMIDGRFEIVLSSPGGELRWTGRVFEHHAAHYDISGDEIDAVERALLHRSRLPPHRATHASIR